MLTDDDKQRRFKQLQAKNYRASLRLEGIHLEQEDDAAIETGLNEIEQIRKLKGHYAR